MRSPQSTQTRLRRMRGFERTSGLVQGQIRKASETRGFGETRLLTHWPEIVGEDIAAMARPVKVSYGKGGFGATLTLLTTGAMAPMLQASLPRIKDKVNACYGYNAISHVRITQTAPTGFAEGRVQFAPAPPKATVAPAPEILSAARDISAGTADDGLRQALELLAKNVLSRTKKPE